MFAYITRHFKIMLWLYHIPHTHNIKRIELWYGRCIYYYQFEQEVLSIAASF